MAKKIRFPLNMNGTDVRTLEELKENFDIESVIGYYTSGQLVTWLKDRYYDNEANAIESLDSNDAELNSKIMSVLGVLYDEASDEIDIDVIQRRNEKLMLLRQITSDQNLINKVDSVAFNQDDLYDILDEGYDSIYLCEGEFDIPLSVKNVTYTGINNPIVILRAYDNVNFASLNIKLVNICFGWDISGTTSADRLYQAEKLMEQSKFNEAINILDVLVEEKNPRAFNVLGAIYEKVYISPENQIKLEKLNNIGTKLGYVFNWIDAGKDFSGYKQLLKKLVDKGDKKAMGYLGFLYLMEHDFDTAVYYLKEGANKNDSICCEALYYIYINDFIGGNVPEKYVDVNTALIYGDKAALLGYTEIANCMGHNYHLCEYGISKNEELAFKYYEIAAKNGRTGCQYLISLMYMNNVGVVKDQSKIVYWLTKASEGGHVDAMFELGKCYENGWGVETDYQKMFELYSKSAKSGNMYAQNELGYCYQVGRIVTQSYELALQWYQKSADNGLQVAKENADYIREEIRKNNQIISDDMLKEIQRAENEQKRKMSSIFDDLRVEIAEIASDKTAESELKDFWNRNS